MVANQMVVRYSNGCLNKEPFDKQTVFNHSNTELVRYSDTHCILIRSAKFRKEKLSKKVFKDIGVAYLDKLVSGTSQCRHKAKEVQPMSGVPASTINQS